MIDGEAMSPRTKASHFPIPVWDFPEVTFLTELRGSQGQCDLSLARWLGQKPLGSPSPSLTPTGKHLAGQRPRSPKHTRTPGREKVSEPPLPQSPGSLKYSQKEHSFAVNQPWVQTLLSVLVGCMIWN